MRNNGLLVINFVKLNDAAEMPKKAHGNDAGFDLKFTSRNTTPAFIEYGTGIAVEIPDGYFGMLVARSSVSKRNQILANCAGIIDAGYRGEILARFKRLSDNADGSNLMYDIGDVGCQLIILPVQEVAFNLVDTLDSSARGTGGFGSTDGKV